MALSASTDSDRFQKAVERFDAANREDPNREVAEGVEQAKELLYARRMSACLDRFGPDAPEPVRLAARCQHIRRWTIPRTDYPEGRNGYRRWRTDLAWFHASTAAAILREVGYDDTTVARVEALLRKERLKTDPDVQLLEDVISVSSSWSTTCPISSRSTTKRSCSACCARPGRKCPTTGVRRHSNSTCQPSCAH